MDIQLRKKRDNKAAYAFMKRLMKIFGEPTVLTTDKAPALLCAFKKLRENGFFKHTTHCTIKDIETIHALYKKNRRLDQTPVFRCAVNYKNYL